MVLLKTWNIDDFNCTFCNWQKRSAEVFYEGVILVRISLFYRTPLVAATDLKIFQDLSDQRCIFDSVRNDN